MVLNEVKSHAPASLAQLIVDTRSVQVIRNRIAIAVAKRVVADALHHRTRVVGQSNRAAQMIGYIINISIRVVRLTILVVNAWAIQDSW